MRSIDFDVLPVNREDASYPLVLGDSHQRGVSKTLGAPFLVSAE
jgi:hypothetical protein